MLQTTSDRVPPDSQAAIGILLMNVGTPEAPTRRALRGYLAQFLSDRRVVDVPRLLWLPLLHGIILNTRPHKSARLYRNIWTEEGSPLLVILRKQATALEDRLKARLPCRVVVEPGMGYGTPSIAEGLQRLRSRNADRILLLPLFPQYSATTTASSLDASMKELMRWVEIPSVHWTESYYQHPAYLDALARSIRDYREIHGSPDRLLFSFHGIPKRYEAKGDPYRYHCEHTAVEVSRRLGLDPTEWAIAFQSRFGPEEWLQPSTDDVLTRWAREGVGAVHVVAAGFSADCLETLDEIDREYREIFEENGNGSFGYIPALNDRPDHIEALAEVAQEAVAGWLTELRRAEEASPEAETSPEADGS